VVPRGAEAELGGSPIDVGGDRVTTDEMYAVRVLQAAMVAASGGLDPNRVADAVTNVVEAIATGRSAQGGDLRPGGL
jgi:hypothetical protein